MSESPIAGPNVVTIAGDELTDSLQASSSVCHKNVISATNCDPLSRARRVDEGQLAAVEGIVALISIPARGSTSSPVTLADLGVGRNSIDRGTSVSCDLLTLARPRCDDRGVPQSEWIKHTIDRPVALRGCNDLR